MHALLTSLIALSGGALAGWGLVRALRARRRGLPPLLARRSRRFALVAYAVGSLLLLLPDQFAGLLVDAGASSSGAASALGFLAALVWRVAVVAGVGVGALVLWLSSERVTAPLGRAARAGLDLLPGSPARAAQRLRRREGLTAFPTTWAGLIEHDRDLAHVLLRREGPFDPRFDPTTVPGWDDPDVRHAMEALVACDRLRTSAPPVGMRDVLTTDYGRAVREFELAVESVTHRLSPPAR